MSQNQQNIKYIEYLEERINKLEEELRNKENELVENNNKIVSTIFHFYIFLEYLFYLF